ncbi:MAG: TetR/AcrR family transcriptional regulator [Bacteroidetes bacterium]|nr:TetR/AcrR family transcriptional regulator [Bacteroidota bacterium]
MAAANITEAVKKTDRTVRLNTIDRKKQIIDEAVKIIHKQGFDALTIRELAYRVNVSEPAIYRHFTNKEEIIVSIMDRMNVFDDELKKHIESISDREKKITELINFHFEFFQTNAELTSIIFSEDIFRNGKALPAKLLHIITQRRQIICKVLEDAKKSREFRGLSSCDLATIILGFIRLAVLQWRLTDFSYSLVEAGNREAKTLIKLIYNYR